MRIDIENNVDVEMMEFDHLLLDGESYKITGWYDDGTVECIEVEEEITEDEFIYTEEAAIMAELDTIDGMLMEHHYLRNILNDIDTW